MGRREVNAGERVNQLVVPVIVEGLPVISLNAWDSAIVIDVSYVIAVLVAQRTCIDPGVVCILYDVDTFSFRRTTPIPPTAAGHGVAPGTA